MANTCYRLILYASSKYDKPRHEITRRLFNATGCYADEKIYIFQRVYFNPLHNNKFNIATVQPCTVDVYKRQTLSRIRLSENA